MDESKLILAALAVVALLSGAAYTAVHLINAGKAECAAAVLKTQETDEAKANQLTATWQGKVDAALTARQAEIDALKDTALKPYTVSLSKYTVRPGVPENPAPAGGAGTAAAGCVHPGMVQQSPERLRDETDFALIQQCDIVSANYRVYYEAWP
jgi:hypothetical protein